ncbi:MAG: sigma-70 family RNA polymerase sigma factor [Cyanobacteria bacterium SBLK]|nr:sigma-70 family RNA polymerase sigma factor [Cyanobacteria bacterium SBLK]
MTELNVHLRQLALEAQRNPPKSIARRIALTKLISAIQQSGELHRSRAHLVGRQADIYDEALQRLLVCICHDIDQYNPENEVLQWANFLLRQRFLRETAYDPHCPSRRPRGQNISELENWHPGMIYNPENLSLLEEIRQYINEDPEGLLRGIYTGNNRQANFQFLAQRLLDGYKWREISRELDIPATTLSSFYQRNLNKILPTLKIYFSSDESTINQENKNACKQ